MPIEIGIRVKTVGSDVWEAELSPDDLVRLGKARETSGARSIIGLKEARQAGDQLFFNSDDVIVFNAGASRSVFVVRLGKPPVSILDRFKRNASSGGSGDQAFLGECRRYLPTTVAKLAEDLIRGVRSQFPGEMREGKARKWVNYPENFVAITIQNRDSSLAIHVKGTPDRHGSGALDLRPDRPGYSRFKISSTSQLGPALDVVKRSAQM